MRTKRRRRFRPELESDAGQEVADGGLSSHRPPFARSVTVDSMVRKLYVHMGRLRCDTEDTQICDNLHLQHPNLLQFACF